jgi:hypothetical protein
VPRWEYCTLILDPAGRLINRVDFHWKGSTKGGCTPEEWQHNLEQDGWQVVMRVQSDEQGPGEPGTTTLIIKREVG